MADLKVNIIATDRASGQINKVAGAAQNLAQQFGALAPGIGRLTAQLGGLVGAGGMAGVSVAIAGLIIAIPKLEDELVGWATGLDKVREEYEKLAPKLEAHLKQLTAIRNQTALLKLEGSARVAVERAQKEKEVNELERRIEILTRRRAIQQAEVEKAGRGVGLIPGAGFIPGLAPALEGAKKSLKETEDELGELRKALRVTEEQAVLLDETLELEKTKEGKKNIEELNKALEKLAEQNYKNMLQIQEAVDLEQKLFVDWAKDLLEITRDTAKVQAEINELGLARLEKSLGTGVTEEAIESGLEKNAATAKKIIEEYREGIARDQAIWLKLQDQRNAVIDRQRQQWERMLDSVRDGAGEIFDAMLTKGEGVFSSLAKFAEGVFQTALRNIFQNAVQGLFTTGAGILSRVGGGAPGGARLQEQIVGAGTSTAITAGAGIATKAGFFGKLGALFGIGGGGAAAGTGGTAAAGGTTAGTTGIFGLTGVAASAATAGLGLAAMLGASFIGGLFKAGENRRLQEQARRAGVIQGQQFAAPETQTRFGIAGGAGYTVETDLTGNIRGIGKVPTVVVNVQNSMIDARHAREAGQVIGQEVSRQILQGGSYLADNIAWASS